MYPNPSSPGTPGGGGKKSLSGMYRDANILGMALAFLATLIFGPLAVEYTTPLVEGLFQDLYHSDLVKFMVALWQLGVYVTVWAIAKAFLVALIVTLTIGLFTRFPGLFLAAA